jgi:hypothetical protein
MPAWALFATQCHAPPSSEAGTAGRREGLVSGGWRIYRAPITRRSCAWCVADRATAEGVGEGKWFLGCIATSGTGASHTSHFRQGAMFCGVLPTFPHPDCLSVSWPTTGGRVDLSSCANVSRSGWAVCVGGAGISRGLPSGARARPRLRRRQANKTEWPNGRDLPRTVRRATSVDKRERQVYCSLPAHA